MESEQKEKALLAMRNLELFHKLVFLRMAGTERNKDQKRTLLRLARGEGRHSKRWEALLEKKPETKSEAGMQLTVSLLQILRRIAGVALIVKIMERVEHNRYSNLDKVLLKARMSKKKLAAIDAIKETEERTEDALEDRIIKGGAVLSNIRDVIFGMSDSLIEVLAAVTGLGAALQAAPLVFVAGLIVAVSGTLSMASGAYLSTNYESTLESESHKLEDKSEGKSASKSAYYVGFFYFLGAVFPISPFAFGIGSFQGILLSTAITMSVLAVVAVVMAVVSDTKILRSVAKTLLISLCAVVVTVLLGIYTRSVLHINI
jgi:VIT1/CCC1 family predicted Fe2+/Mn2+ transporter